MTTTESLKNITLAIETTFPPVGNVLVIASHASDQIFGCGGTIAVLNDKGSRITTLIVSAEEVDTEAALAASHFLALSPPKYLGLSTQFAGYGELLINQLMKAILESSAELVFLPSPTSLRADHLSIGFAGAEAIRRTRREYQVAFYEVFDPLPSPNLVHDISQVNERKLHAMQCFLSPPIDELSASRISGLNKLRAHQLGVRAASAEAFRLISAADLAKGLTGLLEGPMTARSKLGFLTAGANMPLVSVIIRSMNRPTLSDAVASINLQTYSNIEIVLVNALGSGHQNHDDWSGRFPLRFVGVGESLRRSRAANIGLEAALGEYLIFLDDDDWFEADHIHKLIEGIRLQPSFKVAYSGVKCVDESKNPISQKFDVPFDAIRLLADNFIPIHAVLFSRDFLKLGCRLDEAMDLYEDWDFWIQLLTYGDFLQIEGCSAVYRITQNTGFGVKGGDTGAETARWVLHKKWFNRLSVSQITRLMEIIRQDKVKSNQIHDIAMALAERQVQVNNLTAAVEEAKLEVGELTIAFGQSTIQIGDLIAAMDDSKSQIIDLATAIEESKRHIGNLSRSLEVAEDRVRNSDLELADRNAKILELMRIIAERNDLFARLLGSRSWRLTKPLRFFARVLRGEQPLGSDQVRAQLNQYGRRLYQWLPQRLRTPLLHWSYRNFGAVFSGIPNYERWKISGHKSNAVAAVGGAMILLDTVPEATSIQGRIAIHLHMFYHDLAGEFAQHLKNMPYDYDLYISVASDEALEFCKKVFSGLARRGLLTIEKVPNQGRDIGPMFCTFGSRLKDYDYIAHLHSKKSLYNNGATEGWRQYLCANLLGSEERIRQIFSLMQGDSPRGIIYPQNYSGLPYQANTWLASRGAGMAWCARLGIDTIPQGYFDFPAGSMFWAKGPALKPLFDAGITLNDFAEESGQTDGTFAHCLERLLVLSSQKQGFQPGIIKDVQQGTWSAWGHHQYAARSFENMVCQLNDPSIKIVAFDIFDTLLVRPLIDAESIKIIVSQQAGDMAGTLYLQHRQEAEAQARMEARRDIGMTEIYAQLAKRTGLPHEVLQQIRRLEEDVEKASVTPRSGGLALYQKALLTNKRLVLISDMFLPRSAIEKMLQENGVAGWGKLYLSNEVGVRKDTGKLYEHVLSDQNIKSSELLMVGDNERSDWQIPCDMGITGLHVIKPVDFARGIPRLKSLFEANEQGFSLNCELTLGLVLRENFSAISFPELDPDSLFSPSPFNIGYSIVGPMLVGFSQWLLESARTDGVDRFYFLAREGQLMKMVHDIWAEGVQSAPQAHYLVLSRRAVSVPMIKNFEDITAIAKTTYYKNSINNFIFERYGLKIDHNRWAEITQKVKWTFDSQVEVHDLQIDHLLPLLKVLEADIIINGAQERDALLHYLHSMGLNNPGRQAAVDVGYSATIQDYLNRLVERSVEGYYLMTDQKSSVVSGRHGVIIRGCYVENASREDTASQMYLHSFELEKLLSSSDAQIVRYELDGDGNRTGRHRELSEEERSCAKFRSELQSGVLRFATDARRIREQLHPTYLPSRKIAEQIYEAFIAKLSTSEISMLKNVILDDYYCGRGLVA